MWKFRIFNEKGRLLGDTYYAELQQRRTDESSQIYCSINKAMNRFEVKGDTDSSVRGARIDAAVFDMHEHGRCDYRCQQCR